MSTVQLLSPLTPDVFRHRLGKDLYPYRNLDQLPRGRPTSSTASVATTALHRPRQTSPASIFSIASAASPRNNENLSPTQIDRVFGHTSQSKLDQQCGIGVSVNQNGQRLHDEAFTEDTTPNLQKCLEVLPTHDGRVDKDDLLKAALDDLEKYRISRAKDAAAGTEEAQREDAKISETSEDYSAKPLPPMPQLTSRVTEVSDIPCTPLFSRSEIANTSSDFSSEPTVTPTLLRSRQSDSSGFVHTIKTASLSNFSVSMLSRRLRPSQSSESRGFFGSHSRFSTDSDRPATTSSIDDAALWRSVKRRRVIEELVTTEESYVSDLKALVYLISTLLASATSLPSRVRNLVQRNILDILHLHEGMVESLHDAALKSAARRWADTVEPKKLGSPRHIRWRSLDSQVNSVPTPNHRFGDVSSESTAISRSKAKMVGVEPNDLSHIISILRKAMVHFFAYEEYCANHEIIAHDLQRHLPNLWSAYSSGIESLARSLTAINQRDDHGRKALTVGDLLIKPIQRVCKYPLLFDELLSYTPVSDDPTVHAELEQLLQSLQDVVESVNHATQNPETRLQIHRRWSLRAHLTFDRVNLSQEDFRLLGNALLCGVLHIAYQTRHGVTGAYALCVLYQHSLLIALPVAAAAKFDVVALIHLQDLKLDSASDGKGVFVSASRRCLD